MSALDKPLPPVCGRPLWTAPNSLQVYGLGAFEIQNRFCLISKSETLKFLNQNITDL